MTGHQQETQIGPPTLGGGLGIGTNDPSSQLSVIGDRDTSERLAVGTRTADARMPVRGVLGDDAIERRCRPSGAPIDRSGRG